MIASCEGRGHNPHRQQLSGMVQEWPWGRYFDGFWEEAETKTGVLRLFALHHQRSHSHYAQLHYSQARLLEVLLQSGWPCCYPLEDATFSVREKGFSEGGEPDRGAGRVVVLEESPSYVV
ncbi:unnamed protein product [Calypogeia fissa]